MAAMDKYKYMPLSEANLKPAMVSAFDGQNLYVASSSHQPAAASPSPFASLAPTNAEPKLEVRYAMGNYLGGGIAGVVNEAFDKVHQRQVAIKMLNPVGYKLLTPSVLRRAEIIKKGVPLNGPHRLIAREHVYWVKVAGKKELVACYADGRMTPAGCVVTPAMLKELTLEMCVALWGLDADENDDDDKVIDDMDAPPPRREDSNSSGGRHTNNANDRGENELSRSQPQHYSLNGREEVKGSGGTADDDMMMMMLQEEDEDTDRLLLPPRSEHVQVGDVVYTLPSLPAKYKVFLQSRRSIYREIAHMHKLTGNSISGHVAHGGHENVLKLYDVLEYVQPSKSTIFLVLELAAGGELFDRIRSENGVDESVARGYFTQLLSGVLFCHQLGIVHRDLKPENLLLSDTDVLKIADFGLSAHFIAAVSSGADDGRSDVLPELDDDDAIGRSTSSSIMIPAAARFRRLNSIVGSPHYVAPEILQNARYGYDGRKADMWSVGVILYGLLAGSLPFGKELPTCPRYLKFCEWIRSLPCDPQTGKLVFDTSIYQSTAAPVRIPSTPVDATTDDASSNFRLAQVHPNCQPLSSSSASWWLHNAQPPVKPQDPLAGSSNLANGASSSRRGSRVVSFPTWLFPSKLRPQAVFLMASLLHPEPGKRFACEDACRSPWVNGTTH